MDLSLSTHRNVYVTQPPVFFSPNFFQDPDPQSCLLSPNLTALVTCFQSYTVPTNAYNLTTYNTAQPTLLQRDAWHNITYSLLDLSRLDPPTTCKSLVLPDPLHDIYTIASFNDPSTSNTYCVLCEAHSTNTTASANVYAKGWGLVIVPATRSALKRHLHISAPQLVYDSGTAPQAAGLFAAVGAKSLVIPGRFATAFESPTDCVQGKGYFKTDPTHDKNEIFYDTNRAIWTWEFANERCPASSCAFIGFHTKDYTSCTSDLIFLSAGLASSPSSVAWYTDARPRPIKALKKSLEKVFPKFNISLPSDSNCTLTGTADIVGRFLNGVPDEQVCQNETNATLASGMFVQVEQADSVLDKWVKALEDAFTPV